MLNSFGKVLTGISLNGLALGAVAWVGWDVWQSGILHGASVKPADIAHERIDARGQRVDVGAIVRAHLFGTEPREPRVAERKEAPPTRLNLKLVGIIAIGSENQGIALIEAGRGRQQVVRVGQVIGKTDATLSEVRRDHVLIERNGELERLAIKRPELESQPIKSVNGDGALSDNVSQLENLPMPSEEKVAIEQPAQFTSEAQLPEAVESVESVEPRAEAPSPDGTRLTLPF